MGWVVVSVHGEGSSRFAIFSCEECGQTRNLHLTSGQGLPNCPCLESAPDPIHVPRHLVGEDAETYKLKDRIDIQAQEIAAIKHKLEAIARENKSLKGSIDAERLAKNQIVMAYRKKLSEAAALTPEPVPSSDASDDGGVPALP